MKATDLNRALNYVDDAYLMEADTPYKVIETESNNYVTYGSDTVQERDVAFLCWTEDGICYSLLDQNILNPDTLFAMAGDLIQQ